MATLLILLFFSSVVSLLGNSKAIKVGSMTTSFVLTAKGGGSLTEAYDALKIDYPDIFEDIKGTLRGVRRPSPFAGSGSPDFTELSIELKHLPPECIEELRPLFALLARIVQDYTEAKIEGKIVIVESGEENTFWM
ncbi:hypothetical protein [Salipiger thiooxidans]|uniref:hypothetical protein n=1 Tax=Salipiger thiooxidans TaxID=282683 RepID=UPI001CD6A81C|nr:hypothetical protein [Salipiger thiooxidans]MCA0848107.1 hypothetical protein [Salipiger thiooxidans]